MTESNIERGDAEDRTDSPLTQTEIHQEGDSGSSASGSGARGDAEERAGAPVTETDAG